jgi:hypothetical protein
VLGAVLVAKFANAQPLCTAQATKSPQGLFVREVVKKSQALKGAVVRLGLAVLSIF